MSKLTGAALDRAVANAMGVKSVHNCEKWGSAPIKGEGQPMPYGDDLADDPAAVDTTYIEFSLPVAWEEECWAMLDAWFKAKAKENT
jgi:hypothetical protein